MKSVFESAPSVTRSAARRRLNDMVLVGLMSIMTVAAMWGEYYQLPVGRKYLLICFFGVVILSLLTHLKYALGFLVILLVLGANMPEQVAGDLGVNHVALIMTLIALVSAGSSNQYFFKLPTGISENDDEINLADHGVSALFGAVEKRNLMLIRTLLGLGIEPDVRAKGGETPLMLAVSMNYLEAVMVFLEKSADVNASNHAGFTALSVANIKGHAAATTILQEHGAY